MKVFVKNRQKLILILEKIIIYACMLFFSNFFCASFDYVAVHNSTNPIKVIEPRKKQASTGRKYKITIST
jgi:hypothetical protein